MFQNVLIGTDGRQGGRDATALAVLLADPGARFTLVNVYGAGLMPGRGAALLLASECRLAEEMLARERDAVGIDAAIEPCADHSIGRGLKRRATTLGADLIVVGRSRHAGIGRFALGDDASSALNGAPCAVAVANGARVGSEAVHRVAVGYDHSPESASALSVAREFATRCGATLTAVGIVPTLDDQAAQRAPLGSEISPDSLMARERERLARLDGVEDVVVGYGVAGDQLEQVSHSLDLLVVGSRRRGPIARLLHGSTSEHLAGRCACPLLVLPRVSSESEFGLSGHTPAQVGT